MSMAVKRMPASQGARIRKRNTNLAGYTFILPWLIGLIVFTSIPMLYSLYLSFTKYDALGAPKWVGVSNYVNMVQDDTFWKALESNVRFDTMLPCVTFWGGVTCQFGLAAALPRLAAVITAQAGIPSHVLFDTP